MWHELVVSEIRSGLPDPKRIHLRRRNAVSSSKCRLRALIQGASKLHSVSGRFEGEQICSSIDERHEVVDED